MRPLALLIVLAALLSFGVWRLVHEKPAAALGGGTSAPALEAGQGPETALEAGEVTARQEARADATSEVAKNPNHIRGRVVRGSSQRPVGGLQVRCTKQLPPMRIEGPVIIDDGRRARPDSPSAACTSGLDGGFEFDDLERAALYTLEVRGAGWVLAAPLRGITPAEDERLLAVQRIYTASVLATDENGKALMSTCEFLRYARIAPAGECESVPVAESPESQRKRLVLPLPNEPATDGAARNYTFASDCDAARLGPFRVLVACAGFQRQEFEFWAFPEGGGADLTPFHLQRVAEQTGMLRLIQDCSCEGQLCAHLLEGKLVLEPADTTAKKLEFDLTGLVREQVFENVPVGDWSVRVRARSGGFSFPAADLPPLALRVGIDASIVHLPVGNLGAIRWKLRGPGEELARETVPLRPAYAREAEAPVELWLSAVMRGLEAGPHEFLIDADKVASLEGASGILVGNTQRIHVDVAPGETRTVVVHMP